MKVDHNWKIGDEFVLPESKYYSGVYTVTKIDTAYGSDCIWAMFNGTELFSRPHEMKKASKLDKALK